jgi:hypothetical protein
MTATIWPCTNAEYHADTSKVGATMLKTLLDDGPAAYYGRYIGKKPDGTPLIPQDPTPDMILGSAVHALVLEPENFDKLFCSRPAGIDGRTKDGKEKLAEFRLSTIGKQELTGEALLTARAMSAAVLKEPQVREFLETAIKERAIVWTENGIEQKCRADIFVHCPNDYHDCHADLKTAANPRPSHWLSTSAFNPMTAYHYDLQVAAHYPAGITALTGRPCSSGLIVVGKSPPHDVYIYDATPRQHCGQVWRQRALDILAECLETGIWRDPAQDGITDLLPASPWQYPEENYSG